MQHELHTRTAIKSDTKGSFERCKVSCGSFPWAFRCASWQIAIQVEVPHQKFCLQILNTRHRIATWWVNLVQLPSGGWTLYFITIALFMISSWCEEFLQAQECIALSSLVLMSLVLIEKWQCRSWLSFLFPKRHVFIISVLWAG